MTQCPIIQDLLPLYIDDALSPESRALVDAHLADCAACRQVLTELRNSAAPLLTAGADGAAPSDDARFLTRLKRQVGTVIGLALLALVATGYGANQYGEWRADREYGQQYEVRWQQEQSAVAAIAETSPDPLARLKAAGVHLTYSGSHDGDEFRLAYTLAPSAPAEKAITLGVAGRPSPRLYDPATGKELGRMREGGYSLAPGEPGQGQLRFDNVTAPLTGANVELPYLAVYLKPEQELKWEFRRPGEQANVTIGQRFAVAGVEFEVERVRFDGDEVRVDYRQVTPPEQVGLHLLSFRLSDRMGGNWGDDARLDELPDPLRPTQRFDFVASLSKNWSIEVAHAVLALPGPVIPVEVK